MDIIQIAKAAEAGVVSCSGSDCTVCSIIQTVSSIYNFITGLSFAVAVLFLTLSGLVYIFGTGRKSYFLKAKSYARNVILGFIFVLVGWVAIHAVLYSTGYKNIGSWWQFQCGVDSAASYQPVSLKSLSSYSNLGDFLASGSQKGSIKGTVSDAAFMAQLNSLKPGEKITFYLPGKENATQQEVMIPFLAGYKDANGNINIDALETSLLSNLEGSLNGENSGGSSSDNALSLLNSSGNIFSQEQTDYFENLLFSKLMGLDASVISSMSLDEKIQMVTDNMVQYQKQNPVSSTSDSVAKLMNSMVDAAVNQSGEVLASRSSTGGTKSDQVASKDSGDRSETTTDKYDPDKWKVDQSKQNQQYKKDSNYNNLPSSQGENPAGPIDSLDKIKDKNKDDTKICDYSKATNPAEEALIRIECKDELRYNMIHRFVKVIQNTSFQGGFCEGCGKINVNFNFPRELLDQIIVHEATHAGQFCLGLIDMGNIAKVEREACANQMGSICHEKHDENGGIGTDDYVMQELTCSGGKDDQTGKIKGCRQKPHIEYRGGSGGKGQEEVRGYLSRWTTMVTPSGDLKCEAYDWPIKYALSYGDTTMGPYHYGAHSDACGEDKVLGLKTEENNDVKEIVKSQKDCLSKAKENLPKAMECEQSGGSPIEIDSTPAPPPAGM